MSPQAHFEPRAEEDVHAHAAFIAKDSLRAALRFYSEVESAAKLLAGMPGAGPVYGFQTPSLADVHFWPIRHFRNFLIFYRRLPKGGVQIIRVLHGATNVERELER